MRKISGAIERIDVPAVFRAALLPGTFFADDIVIRPGRPQPLHDQLFRCPIGYRHKVNITKLESYILDGAFTVAQFYADIEGHPDQRPVKLALEELSFFSREVRILGVYPASAFRRDPKL